MVQLAIVLGRPQCIGSIQRSHTIIGAPRQKRAVRIGRAEGSVLAVLVVAPRKDSVIVLGCSGRVRRLASASCDNSPVRKRVHRGCDIVRRNVNKRGGSADGGSFRRDGFDGRALVANGDPRSSWISSRLEMRATV